MEQDQGQLLGFPQFVGRDEQPQHSQQQQARQTGLDSYVPLQVITMDSLSDKIYNYKI